MIRPFWHVRSRWDYFAFIAVGQWGALAVAALLGAGSLFYSPLSSFAAILLVPVITANYLAWLTVLSTVLGSKRHPHLSPGWLYHLAALFFGPIVGVHYLYRTGRPLDDDGREIDPFADSAADPAE